MGSTIASLVPLIVGAAALPLYIILTLLLVRTKGGVIKGTAFAAGVMLVRLLQGLLFGYIFAEAIEARGASSGNDLSSILLLVGGILMLITAAWRWFKEEDPDAPPPKWMKTIDRVSPFKAFAGGAVLMMFSMKQWVFTLSAIAVVDEAKLGKAGSVVAYFVFVVAAQSLMLAPIILAAAAPVRAARLLDSEKGWIERHNRMVTVVVSSALGLWFISKGISGLLSDDRPSNDRPAASASRAFIDQSRSPPQPPSDPESSSPETPEGRRGGT
jgi:Sap-like sulfolipid-1-addressing protein